MNANPRPWRCIHLKKGEPQIVNGLKHSTLHKTETRIIDARGQWVRLSLENCMLIVYAVNAHGGAA